MKVVAHISDLRMGRGDTAAATVLREELEQVRPTLVVLSGDVTQRARLNQFQAAREFLRELPCDYLVVPGDHDQPVLNLLERFTKPLHKFRRTICPDLRPWFADDEIAALGMNTTRPLNLRSGRLSFDQLGHVRTRLLPLGAGRIKILVTHHPLLAPDTEERALVDWTASSHQALAMVERCQLDLLLAGHASRSTIGSVHLYRLAEGHAVVAVQAGAPLRSGEAKLSATYNLLELAPHHMVIRQRVRRGPRFEDGKINRYIRTADGWNSEGSVSYTSQI